MEKHLGYFLQIFVCFSFKYKGYPLKGSECRSGILTSVYFTKKF